jgi:hypothetical protein
MMQWLNESQQRCENSEKIGDIIRANDYRAAKEVLSCLYNQVIDYGIQHNWLARAVAKEAAIKSGNLDMILLILDELHVAEDLDESEAVIHDAIWHQCNNPKILKFVLKRLPMDTTPELQEYVDRYSKFTGCPNDDVGTVNKKNQNRESYTEISLPVEYQYDNILQSLPQAILLLGAVIVGMQILDVVPHLDVILPEIVE